MESGIQIGSIWAYRVKRTLGSPAIPAEVLQYGPESAKNKVRIKYLGGEYSGLDEWVPKTRLVVPWDEHNEWFQDEINQLAALEAGDPESHVQYSAVMHIFDDTHHERVFRIGYNTKEYGLLEVVNEEKAETILEASGMSLDDLDAGYRNRAGNIRASWNAALSIAQWLCSSAPEDIVRHMTSYLKEQEYAATYGRSYGDMYISPEACQETLVRSREVVELVFSWCDSGVVETVDREQILLAEVERLRELLKDIARDYRIAGHPRRASNLEKKIYPPIGEQ